MAWADDCRSELSAHVARVTARFAGGASDVGVQAPPGPSMLARAVHGFSLSDFERDVLVLTAAAELDPTLLGPTERPCCGVRVSFADALTRLDQADWSALAPSAPLRRWHLVQADEADPVRGHLRIDERVLHALLGVRSVDAGLQRLARPLAPVDTADRLPSLVAAAHDAAARWSGPAPVSGMAPVLHIVSGDLGLARRVVQLAAERLGLEPWELDVAALPNGPDDLDALGVVLEREVVLGDNVVVLMDDEGEPPARRALKRLLDRTSAPVAIVATGARRDWERPTEHLALERPPSEEIAALWQVGLGPAAEALGDAVDRLVHDFALPIDRVRDVAGEARTAVEQGEDAARSAWRSARRVARGALDGLAQRVESPASWDDLVLPVAQLRALRGIAAHVRQRHKVERLWGFGTRSAENLAVTALFHGPSGVGKTLAARVIAAELDLDLYRIDLSQTVSKYIGETEKNLRAVFDAAEQSAAVLVFDEADALFGKRSDVRDAHDRYANIEVSYLLQRMEGYRGLAVLTTNLPANLDAAFLRRLRYSVPFPFPELVARRSIWQRAFPADAPAAGIDFDALARLTVSGASIANIALGAAVLAADEGRPITMGHLLRATHTEYAKHDRSVSPAELKGWPAPDPPNANHAPDARAVLDAGPARKAPT